MTKPLCELKQSLKSDFKKYKRLVSDPTHVCKKCGRAANKKKLLCSPAKIKGGD